LLEEREIWAMGVFLYRLVLINFPFADKREISGRDILDLIMVVQSEPGARKLSQPLINPMGAMLNKNPYNRAKMADIKKKSLFLMAK
jgi:serine/threonine protein kinase